MYINLDICHRIERDNSYQTLIEEGKSYSTLDHFKNWINENIKNYENFPQFEHTKNVHGTKNIRDKYFNLYQYDEVSIYELMK